MKKILLFALPFAAFMLAVGCKKPEAIAAPVQPVAAAPVQPVAAAALPAAKPVEQKSAAVKPAAKKGK